MTISFLVFLQIEIYSKAHAKQSWIVLLLMNPYWLTCIKVRITSCNLWDRSFVINLIEELRREKGM